MPRAWTVRSRAANNIEESGLGAKSWPQAQAIALRELGRR